MIKPTEAFDDSMGQRFQFWIHLAFHEKLGSVSQALSSMVERLYDEVGRCAFQECQQWKPHRIKTFMESMEGLWINATGYTIYAKNIWTSATVFIYYVHGNLFHSIPLIGNCQE